MKKYIKYLIILALMVIIITACAKIEPDTSCFTGKVYGFWNGLWHGIISWIMFFASLVRDDVAVYAINNNGAWYDFGFLLGVGAWGSSSTIRQDELLEKYFQISGQENIRSNREKVIDNHYLEFEQIYGENGWHVEYNKPDYKASNSSDFEPYFVFRIKNK